MMDASTLSAVAAIVGTAAGSATSILTSWVAARSQTYSQRTVNERNLKQKLYERVIDEASRIYVHALLNRLPTCYFWNPENILSGILVTVGAGFF